MGRGITSLNRLRGSIRELPLRIRSAVAKDAEGILNREMRGAFDAGRTVYDTPRPLSVAKGREGSKLTLKKTGRTYAQLYFVTIGTILRAQLPTKYAKYLIGRYQIMPQSLPAKWRVELEQLVQDYVRIFEEEALR